MTQLQKKPRVELERFVNAIEDVLMEDSTYEDMLFSVRVAYSELIRGDFAEENSQDG